MQGQSILGKIVAARKRRIEEQRAIVSLESLRQACEARPDPRDFAGALAGKGLKVIAELKRASPSRGLLCPNYRRREIAQSYERAGARALSVLTEEQFFLGSLKDLATVREAVRLPVLRKDFIVDAYQVYESAAAGADALLLIVAALDDPQLRGMLRLAERLRVTPLVEVHTESETRRAVDAGARVIGVNNRDLRSLEVNLETSLRLRDKIPASCLAVSESGIKTASDLAKLAEARFDAVLIGEHLMLSGDPGEALARLLESAPTLKAT